VWGEGGGGARQLAGVVLVHVHVQLGKGGRQTGKKKRGPLGGLVFVTTSHQRPPVPPGTSRGEGAFFSIMPLRQAPRPFSGW
jgi:hypothetical protein